MRRYLRLFFGAFLFGSLLFFNHAVAAADFTTNYKVDYYLDENSGNPLTKVKLQVDIINHTAGSYISKFSLSFPKVFKIDNPSALYNVPLTPQVLTSDEVTTIQVNLPQPTQSDKNISTIYFDFYQENLFKINGNVWEVILPTIQMEKESTYEISLHLPENTDKKLSISKPVPSTIDGKIITWTNPDVKTIYTTFGEQQLYALNLLYHLENPGIGRVYTDVAFPPDTLYQKLYINQITPQPSSVFIDEDGNYIGRYYLNPREKKDIVYKGTAEIDSKPRPEVKMYQSSVLDSQKEYLLRKNKFWDVNVKTNLQTVEDIFSYVTSALQYDLKGVNEDKKRLGANEALRNPSKAVCTEFTDVFVALARQKGIYAREVEGFGYSSDLELRPVSGKTDVLHAWPEYYDKQTQEWTPVDPTWQNTSGINYFSSLDLNHISFAIHGKDPEYPFPAGTYKTGDSKDVSVEPVSSRPKELKSVTIESVGIPHRLIAKKLYHTKLVIKNQGNVFAWNIPLKISSDFGLNREITIPVLAPMETKEIPVIFNATNAFKSEDKQMHINIFRKAVYTQNFLLMPYYYDLGLKVGFIIVSGGIALLLVKITRHFLHHRRSHRTSI